MFAVARPTLSSSQVEDFRSRAAEVAMQLFVDNGYDRFSLRTLARELGCSHATPYRYFEDKAEIFAAVRARGFNIFGEFLRMRLQASAQPEERLRILARAYFDFAQQQSAAFRVIFELGQPAADVYPFVGEAGFAAWSVLLDVVREAIEAKVVEGDAELLAHIMWAGIHGVASLQLARKLTVGRPAEQVIGAMMSSLINAHRPGVARLETVPSDSLAGCAELAGPAELPRSTGLPRSTEPPSSTTRPMLAMEENHE